MAGWSSRCWPRRLCTTCTAASGCRPPGDRLTGAAQVQFSVLLGLFVLVKAADYWLDRYDLVSASGKLIAGITYTDDHAVLPAKNILLGIAVICAVLFFLNIWRRTWTLPSVGSRAARAVGDPARHDLARHRAGVPGQAHRAGQGGAVHREQHRRDPAGLRPPGRRRHDVHRHGPVADDGEQKALADTASVPLVDPQLVHQIVRADPAGAVLLLGRRRPRRRPLRDRRHRPRPRARRARARPERPPRRRPQLVQPAHRLHPRQRHHRGVRQPATRRRQRRGAPRSSGPRASRPTRTRCPSATGGYESQVYYGEPSPDYSIVGKRPAGRRTSSSTCRVGEADSETSRTTYAGKGGVPVGSLFHKLLYAVKFGEPELPAVRAGQREQQGALHPQPARAGAEGRAVADRRLRPLPGGGRRPDPVDRRRLHDDRPLPAGGAGVDRRP